MSIFDEVKNECNNSFLHISHIYSALSCVHIPCLVCVCVWQVGTCKVKFIPKSLICNQGETILTAPHLKCVKKFLNINNNFTLAVCHCSGPPPQYCVYREGTLHSHAFWCSNMHMEKGICGFKLKKLYGQLHF